MRKVAVVTGTRAEYGLLKSVIESINTNKALSLQLIVTGAHLSKKFGLTVREIEADGFSYTKTVDILESVDGKSTSTMASSTAIAIQEFERIFLAERPDIIVVLGDRYESFAACTCATLLNIPIAHIHGGELTLGAVDDALRHSMTKMATLHFTSTETYRRRVIGMGEHPDRTFNVGALANDGIKDLIIEREILQKEVGIEFIGPTAVATLHPETKAEVPVEQCVSTFLSALEASSLETIILTSANADRDGEFINKSLSNYAAKTKKNVIFVSSLGHKRYLSVIKHSDVVLGNSSSAMIEAPILGTPSVNIGDRQKGRILAETILNCGFDTNAILESINQALGLKLSNVTHPFGTYGVGARIVNVLATYPLDSNSQKEFYE